MLLDYIKILFPAGILAGIISSAAGLASLVSYPALLAVGIPPVLANVTNTVSLVFGDAGAVSTSGRELRGHKLDLLHLLPLTAGGSLLGGLLLLLLPSDSFERVVPFFILIAAFLVLGPDLPRFKPAGKSPFLSGHPNAGRIVYEILIFLVGAYTGYFGAGGGVIMLALLTTAKTDRFSVCNALKNISLGASNLVAALLFIFRTQICWPAVLPMAAGLYIGGCIGPFIVRRVPAKIMRKVVAAGAFGLFIYLFLQAY